MVNKVGFRIYISYATSIETVFIRLESIYPVPQNPWEIHEREVGSLVPREKKIPALLP